MSLSRIINGRLKLNLLDAKTYVFQCRPNFNGINNLYINKESLLPNHVKLLSTSVITENLKLYPQLPVVVSKRQTSFYSRLTAEELWKGVTSVSNAGKKRGRGKGSRKIYSKNLNKGQYIGVGEENMVWPGLNAPIIRGKEIVKHEKLPKDENREKKLIEMRNTMGVFRPLKLNPLERGWSGTKMPGRSIGPPDPIGDDHFKGFDTKVLELKTVAQMDGIMGRKRRISIFVVTGNKNGLGGYALTKANTMQNAVRKSKNLAGQKLLYIERCDGHTVYHDFFCQYFQTKIFVKRKPEGYGLVCHRAIKEICEVIGIKNLHAKVEGSTNVQNITKAFFVGLLSQKTHKQLADEKGLHVVKVRPGLYPDVVASPHIDEVRSRRDIDMDEEMDFKLYTMDGKVEREQKPFVPFYTRLPSWERHLKKVLKSRNHEKIKRQLVLEHGEIISHLTENNPECRPNYVIPEEE